MNYGGKGKFTLPENHKPFMKVPAGGSSCANCLFLSECGKHCTNKHFIEWYGSSELPTPINEYCSDWYEPKNAAESKQPGGEITDEPHTNGGCDMKHGEKTYNLEGNEVIINKTSMQITDIYAVKGTPKQIASAINELGGGTKFDDGGEIEKITTNIKQNQMETVQPPAHEQLHEKIEKEVIKSHKLITDQILYYPKRDERWKITDLLVDKINIEYQPKYNYEKPRPEFITYEELIRDFDEGSVTVEGFTADEKAELKKAILFTIKEQQYNDLMKEKQATDSDLARMQDEYQKLQAQKDEAESGRDSYKNKFTDVKMESIRGRMQNLKHKIESKKVLTKKFSQKIAELEKKYPFRTKINALKKKAKSKGDGGMIYQKGGEIKNQYKGKTPEQVWTEWTGIQRIHFILDHEALSPFALKIRNIKTIMWDELPDNLGGVSLKNYVANHIDIGQYDKGGQIPSARARERKYTSQQPHEQAYRKDRVSPVRYYKKDGGSFKARVAKAKARKK